MQNGIMQVDKEKSASMDIDVCFVMDCTGSMGSWIAAGKQQIIEIAKSIQKQVDESHGHHVNLRAAFVAYRDHCDGHLRIQENPFTTDIGQICSFCGSMSATGGGDGPEDVAGAMCSVLNLEWKAKAKFIVWVADAPAHGTLVILPPLPYFFLGCAISHASACTIPGLEICSTMVDKLTTILRGVHAAILAT